MNIALNITVSKHDKNLILASGNKSISDAVRKIVNSSNIDTADITERLKSDRLTANLDIETALKIQKIADEVGASAASVARVLVEMYLHSDRTLPCEQDGPTVDRCENCPYHNRRAGDECPYHNRRAEDNH
jgi:hypothetical protein